MSLDESEFLLTDQSAEISRGRKVGTQLNGNKPNRCQCQDHTLRGKSAGCSVLLDGRMRLELRVCVADVEECRLNFDEFHLASNGSSQAGHRMRLPKIDAFKRKFASQCGH